MPAYNLPIKNKSLRIITINLLVFISILLTSFKSLLIINHIKTAIALRAIALPIPFNHIRNNLMSNQSEPLSRRDQIAAAVMQSLIAKGGNYTRKEMAETAVNQADALIKALNSIQA